MPSASTRVVAVCARYLAVCMVALTQPSSNAGEYDEIRQAVIYCINSHDSIKLSEDRMTLCFDGRISENSEVEGRFQELNDHGFLVIRSPGGFFPAAMKIADILLEKDATVVVRDYCFSACANYIFFATHKTHVLRDSVVAWHGGPASGACNGYVEGVRVAPGSDRATMCDNLARQKTFFQARGIQPGFIYNPPTPYTRMMFNLLKSPGSRASGGPTPGYTSQIFWTWNPRNYQVSLKDRIVYANYPNGQSDLDRMIDRLKLKIQIIYDPGL